MLSTTKIYEFSHKQTQSSEKLFKKTKFSLFPSNPYQQYNNQIVQSINELKKKYPSIEISHIKQLLQELDNNAEMVDDILMEEQKKTQLTNMEDEKEETSNIEQKQKIQKVSDPTALKNALVKLYHKLQKEMKQKEALQSKNAQLVKQNEKLKLMNLQLIKNDQEKQHLVQINLDIC